LCFIACARDVRAFGTDAETVMRGVVCQNVRAGITLLNASARSPWLAVSLDGFGRHTPAPMPGLLSIGDAASFIDPFTGSGMLMAMQSGELVADVISNYLDAVINSRSLDDLSATYRTRYHELFASRLRICSLLRKAAFVPG